MTVLPWLRTLSPDRPRSSSVLGAGVLVAVVVAGLVSPGLGYEVGADVAPQLAGLGVGHGMGLGHDHLGRDVLARLLLGARAFVLPGLLAVGVAVGLGLPSGLARVALPSRTAELMALPLRALAALPPLVLVVLILSVLGNGWSQLGLALGLSLAPRLHQAVHQRLAALQRSDYVAAMRAHGVPEVELWVGHLLLGTAGPAVLRTAIRGLGAALVVECTLSYLGGFGVQEPWPSWGNMLVFEWGRGWGAGVWAPIGAVLVTLWACIATAGLFREVDHG